MKTGLKEKLTELVEQLLALENYELAEVVLSQYKSNHLVRIFIYGENGVNVDDCARLSKLIGSLIDESNLLDIDKYALEVSSPGLDRLLTSSRDFKYRIGETVKLDFIDKTRKGFKAEIVSVSEDEVGFITEEGEITEKLSDIKGAQIVF